MRNITVMNLEDYVTSVRDKRWLPINNIREELSRCLKTKYSSVSSSSFKYDKGMHGWFTLLKVACLELDENDYYFAIAYYRSRFRLKQVYLRRQNQYWATSGRNLMSRDIQKMTHVFSAGYQKFVETELQKELKAIGRVPRRLHSEPIIRLSSANRNIFKDFFILSTNAADNKGPFQSFETVTLPYTIRIMVASIDRKGTILDSLTDDLDDEAYNTLASCRESFCEYESDSQLNHNTKTKTNMLGKVRGLSLSAGHTDVLLAYQSSKPNFKLSELKKRTGHGVVDVRAQADKVLIKIWETLLRQQFTLAMRLHSPVFSGSMNEVSEQPITTTPNYPEDSYDEDIE